SLTACASTVLSTGIARPRRRRLEFVEGWCLAQPNFLPNFGSERSDARVGTNGKEKVIAAVHHPHQHLLYQAVVRIHQHVVCLEAIEVKNELNDFKFSSPQQGVTKIEPESGDFWRDDFSRCRLQVNRRLAHFEVRFLQLNRRLTLLFAAKS